jgi:DNA-binding protein H-NS
MTLQELLEQKAALEKQIQATRTQERVFAISQVKGLMEDHGLTPEDLGFKKARSGGSKKAVAVKFRNHATGETWSGRGLQPKWLKAALLDGRKLEDFTV